MANVALMQALTPPPNSPAPAPTMDIAKQQALIDAMREQANSPIQYDPKGAISPFQGLAKLLEAYNASSGQKKIDETVSAEKQKINDAVKTGDFSAIMAAMQSSQLPGYQDMAIKGQLDLGLKDAESKRKMEAIQSLIGASSGGGEMQAGGGSAGRLALAAGAYPELAPYASYVATREKDANPPAPSGYRKTQAGDLEYIPGGDKDPAVISNVEQSKKAAEKQAELSQAATGALQSVDLIRQQASKVSSMKVGPVAGRITGMYDPDVQTLDSLTNQLTLQAKALLGMPSANFSDADRNFLERIVGGSKVSKEALMQNLDNIEMLAKKAMSGKQPNMGDAVNSPAGGAPQAGAVEDGYRFKGGNPADPNAWEPAQ